jgi:hypothetical protein
VGLFLHFCYPPLRHSKPLREAPGTFSAMPRSGFVFTFSEIPIMPAGQTEEASAASIIPQQMAPDIQ